MLLTVMDVLSSEVAGELCTMLDAHDADVPEDASAAVVEAVQSHPLLALGVQPRSISRPSFRRFDEGMDLQDAVDKTIVSDHEPMRADVGISVFLSDPSDYLGGDLLVDIGYGYESYKPPAGGCVVRPTSARYGVAPVIRGHRWTAELWAQSLIRGPAEREILYDIGYSVHLLELFGRDVSTEVDRLRVCQESLLRFWAEP
jgi:PKHD-type hydroxylase